MTLVIYSKTKEGAIKRLIRIVELLIPKNRMDICHSIDELSSRLKRSVLDQRIVILFVASREEFQEILSMKDLLDNCRLILVLPNSDPDIVAGVHKLRPRFVTDYQSDFVDVAAVLQMMMRNIERQLVHAAKCEQSK